MVKRVCQIIKIKPECLEEYKRVRSRPTLVDSQRHTDCSRSEWNDDSSTLMPGLQSC